MPSRTNPTPIFFGIETELALFGTASTGGPAPVDAVIHHVESTAYQSIQHIRAASGAGGMFLGNGGRFYRDGGGGHLELCTPEVDHPDDLVMQVLAGERLMLELASRAEGADAFREIHVSGANHCYHSSNSWGHHENYSGHVRPEDMTSFLATRFIVDGGGGFVNPSNLIRFTISPRIHFIAVSTGNDTQRERSLHNLKNEPLGSRPRTHVITADGTRSHSSLWLRIATTALVVRLSDLKISIPPSARLKEPVVAAHRFALDPTFSTTAETKDGKQRSAIEVQRAYLALIEDHLDQLPEWAPRACARWREILDQLQTSGWRSLGNRLDWCIKRALVFDRHIAKAGWSWEKIATWNAALEQLESRLDAEQSYRLNLNAFDPGHLDSHLTKALEAGWLSGDGIDPGELQGFARLRGELRALDLRYMLLGPGSLFQSLDSIGLLDHEIDGVVAPANDGIDLPLPSTGRARLRGKLVRDHGTQPGKPGKDPRRYYATWSQFVDRKKNRVIEMPDVREAKRVWQQGEPVSERPRLSDLRRQRDTLTVERALMVAHRAIHGGTDLESGLHALAGRGVRVAAERLSPHLTTSYWRNLARIQARRQDLAATLAALARLATVEEDQFENLCDQGNLRNMLTLRSHESARGAIAEMDRYLESHPQPRFSGLACWRAHTAAAFNRNGDPEAARTLLESTLADRQFDTLNTLVSGRTKLAMAESLRLSGSRGTLAQARLHALSALERYRADSCRGPIAELALLQLAKLQFHGGDPEEAVALLKEALDLQTALSHPAFLRTYLLLARLDPGLRSTGRRKLRGKVESVISNRPAYQQCPLAAKIISEWDRWCSGGDDPDPPGCENYFWGV